VNKFRKLVVAWRRVGRKLGDAQAGLLLTVFYFVVLGPFALAIRWWADPLAIKASTPRGWQPRQERGEGRLERARKQS